MKATAPEENKKAPSKGGFFKASNIILILLAVFLGACYREYQRKNWFNAKPLQKEQFQSHPFTVLEVPITYYKVGEIGKVLKGWHKGKGLEPYIHMYRPDPNGPKFEFDLNKLQAKAQFEKFDENCTVLESVICKTCVFMNDEDHVIMNVTEIFKKPTYYYSAFAKLDNVEAIANSLTAIGIPDVDPKKMILEHAFAGNFPKDIITAYIHGNTMTSSMSITFAGSKSWLYWDPKNYRGREYLDAFPGSGVSIPSKGPDGHHEVYYVQTFPGDILFFSENFGHAVYTHKGPNFMINFRKLELGNFLRRPFDWLHAGFNNALHRPKHRLGRDSTPYNNLMDIWFPKINNLCADGKRSGWDEDMTNLLLHGPQKK
eukprot:gene1376-1497_t